MSTARLSACWTDCATATVVPLMAAADTSVIVLTCRGDELHRVRLREHGADDVVEKPFGYPELRARTRQGSAAAYHAASAGRADSGGSIRIDRAIRRVTVGAREVSVSGTEYRLCADWRLSPIGYSPARS